MAMLKFRDAMNDEQLGTEYWCSFYGRREAPALPSQFALFVANEIQTGELPPVRTVFDVGCGNGRDAFFFLRLGYRVRGIDRSCAAIEACRERLASNGDGDRSLAAFFEGAADDPSAWERLADGVDGPVLVYARFFFHAIDAATEAGVLKLAARQLSERGGALSVEFRTDHDRDTEKATPPHFRRFISADDFARRIEENGMRVLWRTDGRGMAKYRADDAHVARILAIPR